MTSGADYKTKPVVICVADYRTKPILQVKLTKDKTM